MLGAPAECDYSTSLKVDLSLVKGGIQALTTVVMGATPANQRPIVGGTGRFLLTYYGWNGESLRLAQAVAPGGPKHLRRLMTVDRS